MPKLQSFFYCMGVEQNANNGTNLINVVPFFNIEFLPSTFSFTSAFTIIDLDLGKHLVKFEFLDPQDNIIALKDNASFDMAQLMKNDPSEGLSILPDSHKAILGILSFNNVIFRVKGTYTGKLYLDGEIIAEVPIYTGQKKQSNNC